MKVHALAFIGYPVTDMARARGFYERLLGLRPAMVFEHEGRQWVEYELAGGTFAIANMNPSWRPSADGPCAAFEVDDFAGSVEALRACGAVFLMEPVDTGVCQLAAVADPDGNSIAIQRRYVDA